MKNNLLSAVYHFLINYDEAMQKAERYQRALKTEDWKFLQDVVLTIKSEMQTDMLSKTHMLLSPEEKDVTQRTYYHINQILDFILNPVGWTKERQKKRQPQGKVNPNQRKEGNKWQKK